MIDPQSAGIGAVAILAIGSIAAVAKMALTKSSTKASSGELAEAQWILNITRIVQDENEKLRVRIKEELTRAQVDADKAQIALHLAISDTERNIIKAVIKNGH